MVVEVINYRSTTQIVVEEVCRKAGTIELLLQGLRSQAADADRRRGLGVVVG
jgi:hypothetical protein